LRRLYIGNKQVVTAGFFGNTGERKADMKDIVAYLNSGVTLRFLFDIPALLDKALLDSGVTLRLLFDMSALLDKALL
jgi:hypothetical protein